MKLSNEEKRKVSMALRIVFISLIMMALILNFQAVLNAVKDFLEIISPFLYGLGLAFLVNMPMRKIENILRKIPILQKNPRPISMLLSFVFIISFFVFTIAIIVPKVVESISTFIPLIPGQLKNFKSYIENASWLGGLREPINEYINSLITNINNLSMQEFIKTYFGSIDFAAIISKLASDLYLQLSSALGMALSAFLSLVFSIYILISKEKLSKQVKSLIYAVLPNKHADFVMYASYTAYDNFYNFFTGQFVEAILLAVMNYAGMTILGFDYSLVISLLTMMGAFIPMVGAFLTGLVGGLMLLTQSPVVAISYIFYIALLQQLEGNIVYPRVVGQSLGLPGMWVLLAVLLGGSMMGLFGMFLFVPLAATMYAMLGDYMDRRLAEKNIQI